MISVRQMNVGLREVAYAPSRRVWFRQRSYSGTCLVQSLVCECRLDPGMPESVGVSLYEVESMRDSVYRGSSLMTFVLWGLNLTGLQGGM